MVLVLSFLLGATLAKANVERVAVVTTAKGAVDARFTGNVWFSLERRMSKLGGRVQIVDASEQITKLRGDSGALVEGCGGSVHCLSGIGARLGVDRLLVAEVEEQGSGFSCKLVLIEVQAHSAVAELTFTLRASGEVDRKLDPDLKRIFAAKLTSPEPATQQQVSLNRPVAVAPRRKSDKVEVLPAAPLKTVAPPITEMTPPALSQRTLIEIERKPYKPTALGVTGIVTLVFSAATLGAAIGLGVSGETMRATITDRTGQISAVRVGSDANLRATLANAFYSASAAGLVAGGACFTIDLWRERTR